MNLHGPGFLLGLLATLSLAGCSGGDMTPIRGAVTFRGEPLPHGRISFYPAAGRPAFGDIVDGQFELTTIHPGDGAVRGLHRIAVHSDAPQADPFADAVSLIPTRYRSPDTSQLTAEVPPPTGAFHIELVD